MIILDTNIASALMFTDPSGRDNIVEEWLATVSPREIYITTITRAEIRYGIALLPESDRRKRLSRAAERLFITLADMTLAFTSGAADRYGVILADRRRLGKPMSILDAQIAAITLETRATLATANTKDFEPSPIRLVNPYDRLTWTYPK